MASCMDVGRLQLGSIYLEETHWLVCQCLADLVCSSAEVRAPSKNKPGCNRSKEVLKITRPHGPISGPFFWWETCSLAPSAFCRDF